jgi:hypothetical protein
LFDQKLIDKKAKNRSGGDLSLPLLLYFTNLSPGDKHFVQRLE